MSSRSKKIVQLALASAENNPESNAIKMQLAETHPHHLKNLGQNSLYQFSENEYVSEIKGPTKLNLKRAHRATYAEQSSSDETALFSSGSSDDYLPSSSQESVSFFENSELETVKCQIDSAESPKVQNSCNSPPTVRKPKKRLQNKDNWIKVKAKLLKNSGKSYLSRTGKIVEAKKMGPPCPSKCLLACSTRFSEEFRVHLFEQYWRLASLQRQRDFLSSCVEQLQLKYRRISANEPRRPNCSFHIMNNGQRVRVCKKFLINTLGIGERTIRTIIQSKMSGNGIIPEDKRGKHNNRRKIDEEILQSIRDHINSVPRIESHYVRSETHREFIDGGLTIAEMHRHYTIARSSVNKPAANYDTFTRIFNTEFNIGFYIPKKDQCDLCEAYRNTDGKEKEKIQNRYVEHIDEKKLSRIEKGKDKLKAENSEIALAVYDLQAVLPVPMGQCSSFFYKSRLNCYNFTVSTHKFILLFCLVEY